MCALYSSADWQGDCSLAGVIRYCNCQPLLLHMLCALMLAVIDAFTHVHSCFDVSIQPLLFVLAKAIADSSICSCAVRVLRRPP